VLLFKSESITNEREDMVIAMLIPIINPMIMPFFELPTI
jgi:hypothetical protein